MIDNQVLGFFSAIYTWDKSPSSRNYWAGCAFCWLGKFVQNKTHVMYIRKCYPWKLGCVDFSKPMIGTMIPTTSSIGSIKWRMIVTIIYYHRFVNLLKVKLSFPIYRPPGVHLNYEDQARYGNRFKCNTYGMTWIWISPETSRCYIISWRTSLVRVSPLFFGFWWYHL
jgi:hypothetical protein